MSFKPPTKAEWRWTDLAALTQIEDALLQGGDARMALLKIIQDAQTDAFHHGRRHVQRTIVGALDIHAVIKERRNG